MVIIEKTIISSISVNPACFDTTECSFFIMDYSQRTRSWLHIRYYSNLSLENLMCFPNTHKLCTLFHCLNSNNYHCGMHLSLRDRMGLFACTWLLHHYS